jgi:hypothetical protein
VGDRGLGGNFLCIPRPVPRLARHHLGRFGGLLRNRRVGGHTLEGTVKALRSRAAVVLFLGSLGVSVYAWLSLQTAFDAPDLRRYQHNLTSDLVWVLFAILLTIAYIIAARGRWRLAAAVPLAVCLFLAYGIAVLWPHASA